MQSAFPAGGPFPSAAGTEHSANAQLRAKAMELEAAFLSEMLSYTGLGQETSGLGGGIGEEQFASFLRAEQAKLMVQRGGIGLAETIFDALVKAEETTNAK